MNFYTSHFRKKFIDEFVQLKRPIPDLALYTLLDVQKNSSDPAERQTFTDLLSCYSLGAVVPTISGINGLRWHIVEPS